MAKPFKEGKTWSIRCRAKGHDEYRSGFRTSADAAGAERDHLLALKKRGKPRLMGPTGTTVAQALQDFGLQTLRYLKGARQEANRINKYLRAV